MKMKTNSVLRFTLYVSLLLIGFLPAQESEADSKKFQYLKALAEGGNAYAQFAIGVDYEIGFGVSRDISKSVDWIRKSAEQNYGPAQLYLGNNYAIGRGVSKNESAAARWILKAAEKNIVEAQFNMGVFYSNGRGVSKNDVEAAGWFRKAADQNYASAQYNLGLLYSRGQGVPIDYIESYKWLNLASAQGHREAKKTVSLLSGMLSSNQIAEAQRLTREFKPNVLQDSNRTEPLVAIGGAGQTVSPTPKSPPLLQPQPVTIPQSKNQDPQPIGSGSGVFVSDDGLILTAAHVVAGGKGMVVVSKNGKSVATMVNIDATNDVALLKISGSFSPAPLRESKTVKLGEAVFTVGFPNVEVQGFSPKLTKGEISSMAGIQDDPRSWQISVPVQPGNSGGPLFDESGNVIGIVVSKLNAVKMAKLTGDVPQNVNYAVKDAYALPLMEPYADKMIPEQKVSWFKAPFSDVASRASQSTVLIIVYDAPIESPVIVSKEQTLTASQTKIAQPSASSPPPPLRQDSDEALIIRFIQDFLRQGMASSTVDEIRYYADTVDYFNEGIHDQSYVFKDLEDYNKRWPTRSYSTRGTPTVQPIENGLFQVSYILDYSASDASTTRAGAVAAVVIVRKKSSGVGQFEITSIRQTKLKP